MHREGNLDKDPKMLTKSTLYDGTNLNTNREKGYISDFYKNKGQYSSSEGRRANPAFDYHGAAMNAVVPTNGNPAKQLNKIQSKKFFKSKIDFAAPIKSLQQKGGTLDANLSDDSYIDN